MEFIDFRITGLSDEIEPSARGSAMRKMHLKLNSEPPQQWISIFENERAYPRHTMWREAHISGSDIVVDCVPEEIEKYHLKDLKEDVANANTKFRSWLASIDANNKADQERTDAEKKRVDDLRARLKF